MFYVFSTIGILISAPLGSSYSNSFLSESIVLFYYDSVESDLGLTDKFIRKFVEVSEYFTHLTFITIPCFKNSCNRYQVYAFPQIIGYSVSYYGKITVNGIISWIENQGFVNETFKLISSSLQLNKLKSETDKCNVVLYFSTIATSSLKFRKLYRKVFNAFRNDNITFSYVNCDMLRSSCTNEIDLLPSVVIYKNDVSAYRVHSIKKPNELVSHINSACNTHRQLNGFYFTNYGLTDYVKDFINLTFNEVRVPDHIVEKIDNSTVDFLVNTYKRYKNDKLMGSPWKYKKLFKSHIRNKQMSDKKSNELMLKFNFLDYICLNML